MRVLMQVTNSTAVEFTEGMRLGLGVVYQHPDIGMDSISLEFLSALGGTPEDFQNETAPLVSASTAFKHPIISGDQIVWEIALKHVSAGKIALHPSIIFRNVPEEPTYAVSVGGSSKKSSRLPRRNSTSSVAGGEDDFQVSTKEKGAGFGGDEADTEDIAIAGDPIELSPLLGLQPCPLVFFRDSWGDLDTFRFLWFRMPHAVPPIKLKPKSSAKDTGFGGFQSEMEDEIGDDETEDVIGKGLAEASSLLFEGEAIPGGFATKLWAFMSLSGERVMCVMTETENNTLSLHLKSDCKSLIYTLVGSRGCRQAVVAAVVTGMNAAG